MEKRTPPPPIFPSYFVLVPQTYDCARPRDCSAVRMVPLEATSFTRLKDDDDRAR